MLPYVNDLSMIKETVNRYKLTETQKEKIVEESGLIMTADRILQNHNRISKRFNIELEVSKFRSKGLKNITESCCTMIDTFKIQSYQKLNICLEELTYLLQKNSFNYDPADLVSYVTEYFVLRSPDLNKEINGFRKALNESYCIESDDLDKVDYIFKEYSDNSNGYTSIKTEIEKFLRDPDKSIERLDTCTINSLENNTNNDIIRNIDKLIFLHFDVQKSGLSNGKKYDEILFVFSNRLIRRVEDGISAFKGEFTSDDIEALIRNIENVKSIITSNVDDNTEYSYMIHIFKSQLDDLIKKLKILNNIAYGYYNIQTINKVNEANETLQTIEEFKIFKFHNMINAAINLNKFLKKKEKDIYDINSKKARNIIQKVKNVLVFGENSTIYNYIGEDNRVDICVAQYYINEAELETIHKVFGNACKEYNFILATEDKSNALAYYVINPGILEVHLKDTTNLNITEEEYKQIRESESPELNIYIEEFANIQAISSSIKSFTENSTIDIESLQDKLFKFGINCEGKEFDLIHYKAIMECLSLLNASKGDIDIFSEKFSNYRYNYAVLESVITESEYSKETQDISSIMENWEKVVIVPLDIQWEAYQILSAILEDAPNKTDKKVSDKEFKKNPFKGININSIYLYLEGLKAKTKNMSQKEKEISRNMDNNFRVFVKGMKNALISDRREAIIKGSVIPSFSRCVKLCIGLAGTGVISGNPLIPVIIALGGFAMSKRLTQKERILMLDEIEIELDVVEKEISLAESRNQIKKYRDLLRYKKELQRQYQRIRYNVRVGKDILPSSSAGFRNND